MKKVVPSSRKKLLSKFVVNSCIIYISWLIAYYSFILPNGKINDWLTRNVSSTAAQLLDAIGFDSSTGENVIYIDKNPTVLVSNACNGLSLFALFAGFIMAFPGKIKYKALVIPIGIFILYISNIIREVTLALNYLYFEKTFNFNHHYTYSIAVYIIVFLIWRYWLRSYSVLGLKTNE